MNTIAIRTSCCVLICLSILVGCGMDPQHQSESTILERNKTKLREAMGSRTPEHVKELVVNKMKPPTHDWHGMSMIERMRHMQNSLMPVMYYYFRQYAETHRKKSFKLRNITCGTCHGSNVISVRATPDFSKPTTLAPLSEEEATDTLHPDDGDMKIFMKQTIMPVMRTLLGNPHANCFTCHARK